MAAVATRAPLGAQGKVRLPGNVDLMAFDVAFDSSYPTGGEPVTAATFGLAHLYAVVDAGRVAGSAVHRVRHDRAAGTLMSYQATGAETAAATNLSADTARVLVVGR